MSHTAAAVLMRQAQLHRKHADKARRLAWSFSTPDVIERLEQFARELDSKASELELRARELHGSISHTRKLAAEIHAIAGAHGPLEITVPANDNAD